MKRIIAVLLLWLPFSIAAIAAIPVLLWGVLTNDASIWRPVGRAMDKLLATLLGFNGNFTLSAELGAGEKYQWLRKILDKIESDHCRKAAIAEGRI